MIYRGWSNLDIPSSTGPSVVKYCKEGVTLTVQNEDP